MAKRRLSQRQRRRIRDNQSNIDLDDASNLTGLVVSHRGGEVEVEPDGDSTSNVFCKLRSNLGDIVSGDRVVYRSENDEPAIVAILPRDNLLQREDGFGQVKSVAANVTQLIVCLAVEPEPNRFLLDQYLLSAEQQSMNAIILLNKIDLRQGDDPDPFNLKEIYQPMGYEVLHSSIHDAPSIELLQRHCRDQVNVISGVSGVGKSSLTQAILPGLDIRIGEISEANREGRHTTRTSRLYHLPQGGILIDTPGVRGFKPIIDGNRAIAAGFREIQRLGAYCRFNDCRHINEPGCAVRPALDSGELDPERYNSYVKMLEEQSA
jgi:ribosome biogenesis GTPase